MNWNVIFAHTWPDAWYQMGVNYLSTGRSTSEMPRSLVRRFQTVPYRLNEHNEIVLSVMHAPWSVNRNNKVVLMDSNKPYVFKVIKESEREQTLNSFIDDPKSVGLNAHTLLDKVFRAGYIGISRRYIQAYLTNNPRTASIRMSKADLTKPVVKSFRPEYPFQHWQMDLIDYSKLYKENKNFKYILVIMDIFSKFVYLFPLKYKGVLNDTNASGNNDIPYVLNKLFLSGDIPDILHSDQGTEFRNRAVHEICAEFGVKQIFGKPYSPQTQGFVENKNKHIKAMINAYFTKYSKAVWYAILDRIAYTINNSKHFVTGYTPMQLHRGRDVNKSYSIEVDTENANIEFTFEPDSHQKYHERQQTLYDRRVNHVSNVLKSEATKRELAHDKKNTVEIHIGSIVRVATFVRTTDAHVQAILIKIGNRVIENPLKYTRNKVSRRLADLKSRPESIFSKTELRMRKYYPQLFKVHGIHRMDNVVRYNLVEYNQDSQENRTQENRRVYIKVAKDYQTMTNIYPENRVWDDRFRKAYLFPLNPLEFNRYANIPSAPRPNFLSMIGVDYLNLTGTDTENTNHQTMSDRETVFFIDNKPVKIVKVAGDGNCMFHAIMRGLQGIGRSIPYNTHNHLRQEVVRRNYESCIQSPDLLVQLGSSLNTSFKSCDEYREQMSMLGTWGSDAELSQIKRILEEHQIVLHVFQLSAENILSLVAGYDTPGTDDIVRILRVNQNHYDTILEVEPRRNNANGNGNVNADNSPCTIEFIMGPQYRRKIIKQKIMYIWLVNKKPKPYEGKISKYIGAKVQTEGPFAGKRMGNYFEIRGVVENNGQVTRHDLELRPELYGKTIKDGWWFVEEAVVFEKCKRALTKRTR